MLVSYGNIKLEMRRATIRDGNLREWIVARLQSVYGLNGDGRGQDEAFRIFGRLCSQTVSADGLPFSLPTFNSSDAELRAAYEAWGEQDESAILPVVDAIVELLRPADLATGPLPLPEIADPNS